MSSANNSATNATYPKAKGTLLFFEIDKYPNTPTPITSRIQRRVTVPEYPSKAEIAFVPAIIFTSGFVVENMATPTSWTAIPTIEIINAFFCRR